MSRSDAADGYRAGADNCDQSQWTVRRLGEFGVIDRMVLGRAQPQSTVLGPGDDAAIVAAGAPGIVVSTDMLVQGQHFRLDWSTPHQIGRKAIAQNAADIVAMGAVPTAFLVALGCPGDTPLAVTDGLTQGLWDEALAVGAGVVGGDLVNSEQLIISITALGDLRGAPAVLRSGAAPGDTVALAGRLGYSGAGLDLLSRGAGLAADPVFAELIAAHQVPEPPYGAGPQAARAGATAMTDVSDGLLADAGHIAESSDVTIVLEAALLPVVQVLRDAGRRLGVDPLEWILASGEDHALVATFPGARALPAGWTAIGSVVERSDGGPALLDGAAWTARRAWQSFDQ